jgi:hypothetical protein
VTGVGHTRDVQEMGNNNSELRTLVRQDIPFGTLITEKFDEPIYVSLIHNVSLTHKCN